MKITLHKSDYDRILDAAVKNLPEEACGLIAGTEERSLEDAGSGASGQKGHSEDGADPKKGTAAVRHIEKVYLLTNVDHSNEHFTMDPKEQLEAVKDMRAHGLKPLGNWHSHPESPSRPSAEDIRLSFDIHATYMILSLMDRENPVLKAFHTDKAAGNYAAEDLVILPD